MSCTGTLKTSTWSTSEGHGTISCDDVPFFCRFHQEWELIACDNVSDNIYCHYADVNNGGKEDMVVGCKLSFDLRLYFDPDPRPYATNITITDTPKGKGKGKSREQIIAAYMESRPDRYGKGVTGRK